MNKKTRPSELKRKEIKELLDREGLGAVEEFHRPLGTEKLFQEALEAEGPQYWREEVRQLDSWRAVEHQTNVER